mmetsp:Transcript_13136/g.28393  ORF Transcript_13136/g.28393 Transcript_13136/m.28393 type:complete len:598 (-) Transcript_13136:37-1830(-)
MAKKKKKSGNKDCDTYVSSGESKGEKRKHQQLHSNDQFKSSLAQLLKKYRGVAANTAPPPIWNGKIGGQCNFLTPQDDPQAFRECMKKSFSGFHYDVRDSLPSSLHREFDSSFAGMEQGGLFLYDTVQPGKRRLTRTSVTRTLVGDPGSTYKYLGLRLFSHPWVDVDEEGDAIDKGHAEQANGSTLRKLGYSGKTTSALMTMGLSNLRLIERSKSMLQKYVSPHISPPGLVGSADFNLTLVNKMESTSTKRDMKKEVSYGMGKISVGWHRDSGLKDFSSIAVYQTLKQSSVNDNDSCSWSVALRAMDGGAGGPLESVPPLMVPLPSGSLYYMLDDFNHNHEHAVIAGSGGVRYSSTHRVAREGQGTWQYIRDKIQIFSSGAADFDLGKGIVTTNLSSRKRRDKLVSRVRANEKLMSEIEFEWLRQWFVQGKKHALLHPYWSRPISILCDSFSELERESTKIINLLETSWNGLRETDVTEDLFDVLIESLSERSKLRFYWKERYRDPIFGGISLDERPFSCPCLGREEEDLDLLVSKLRQWRSEFVAFNVSEESLDTGREPGAKKRKKSKKSKSGSMTKKESKRTASNWEQLKVNLKG